MMTYILDNIIAALYFDLFNTPLNPLFIEGKQNLDSPP